MGSEEEEEQGGGNRVKLAGRRARARDGITPLRCVGRCQGKPVSRRGAAGEGRLPFLPTGPTSRPSIPCLRPPSVRAAYAWQSKQTLVKHAGHDRTADARPPPPGPIRGAAPCSRQASQPAIHPASK